MNEEIRLNIPDASEEKAKAKVKKSHLGVKIIAIVVIVLIVAASIPLYMVTRPLNEGRFTVEATTDLKKNFMKAMLIGGVTEFTNDDFNGMLAYSAEQKRQKAKEKGKSEKVTLTEFDFNADGVSKLYARSFSGFLTFDVQADANMYLDKENNLVVIELSNGKLGNIPISTKFILEQFKKSQEEDSEDDANDAFGEFLTVTDNAITFPATYSFSFLGTELNFGFDEVEVEEDKLVLTAKKPLGDYGELVYSLLFGE
ncbi:MAG: hypothetical protein ACI4II_08330 [Acutalibacteraceae bacterium]